jgi:hypothetical protein
LKNNRFQKPLSRDSELQQVACFRKHQSKLHLNSNFEAKTIVHIVYVDY